MAMYLCLVLAAGGGIVLLWLLFAVRAAARGAVRQAQMEQVVHDVQKAEMARDRLLSDPVYRRRVRERFTRS